MRWPFILRSTHEAIVNRFHDDIRETQNLLDHARMTNVQDICEFVVAGYPELQQEFIKHRNEFIGKK